LLELGGGEHELEVRLEPVDIPHPLVTVVLLKADASTGRARAARGQRERG
jgi:hypothetical protein